MNVAACYSVLLELIRIHKIDEQCYKSGRELLTSIGILRFDKCSVNKFES